ncbi:hypothetical protein C1645_745256 [Glomus cerebriforme]|uniref:Uncharacterized protein n=1 Tax=Glomus cerebriforme TaxID=658196 RepID=A0A397S6N9_9GLOM|nr:hypothetical protein C1645_745256 [Glomus cerebriforme]
MGRWYTQCAGNLPCGLLEAVPFVFVAFIIANIFGAIWLLLRENARNVENIGNNKGNKQIPMNDNNINEIFLSTREALKTILPQASNKDIEKYEEQLSKVNNFDPVLIIIANQNWINQNTYVNYQAVMYSFATNNLQNNRRRDEDSLSIFHFPNLTELYTVRGNIRMQYPNAFFDRNAQSQQEPIGTAWILTNVAVHKSDYAEDDSFFVI